MTARRVAVALALVGAVSLGFGGGRATAHPSPAPVRITEDSPAWDCATMGNRICGPVTP